MEGKTILTLLGVVCAAALAWGDVNAPMEEKREIATPEVVLQLKYEQGALNRIYLTQFRPEGSGASVPAATQLCSDLCHSGLGGESCGATCTDMMPVGLATALRTQNHSSTQFGQPRVRVCPTLCANQLGTPLCKCPDQPQVGDHPTAVDWDAVCDVFCLNDGYVLGGCPACKKISIPPIAAGLANSRLLDTAEGWISWCNVQCRQGHGGAACNCDRAPFQ